MASSTALKGGYWRRISKKLSPSATMLDALHLYLIEAQGLGVNGA